MNMDKTLFFDYGGTLDTNGVHWSEVLWQQYQAENVPVGKEQFLDSYVYAERKLGNEPIIDADDTFVDVLRKKVWFETEMLAENGFLDVQEVTRRAYVEHIALRCDFHVRHNMERIKPMLSSLSEKYRLVLVSNFYGNLNSVLNAYGIQPFFTDVVESAQVGLRKPDAEIYRLAMDRSNTTPDKAVIIGDSVKNDIRPGLSLGATTVWLKGKGWGRDTSTGNENLVLPSFIITDIMQLRDVLQP